MVRFRKVRVEERFLFWRGFEEVCFDLDCVLCLFSV